MSLAETARPADPAPRNPLHSIWRRRWIVVGCTGLAVAAAIAYLLLATPIYESRSELYVQPSGPRIWGGDALSVMAQAKNYYETQCRVIRSGAILSRVAQRPGVSDLRTFRGAEAANVLAYLKNNVFAGVGRNNDVISVAVRSPFPDDAATLANEVVAAYVEYHSTQLRSTAAEVLDLLRRQKGQTERDLAERREAKLEFQRRFAGLSLGTGQDNPTLQRLGRLSTALTEAQLSVLDAQASLEATRAMAGDPQKIRQLLDSRAFRQDNAELRRELRQLQQRMAGLGATYLPNYPDLQLMQGSLRTLAGELEAEDRKAVEAYLAELEQRVLAEQKNERQIREYLNEQQKLVLELNTRAAEFEVLRAEHERLDRAAAGIDQRIQELAMLGDAGAMNISVLETAKPEGLPVEPSIPTTLAKALLGGLLLGAGLALARDLLDQRLRGVDEIKALLDLPVLGVVPHMDGIADAVARGSVVEHDPASEVAEAYRAIRTAVYFGPGQAPARTLLITSPGPGDGKSTLAANLAIAMAQAGNRVLLLDADFRKPVQQRVFGLTERAGVSDLLAGAATLEDVLRSTATPGLTVLPCGRIPSNPAEILNGRAFADLLSNLSSRFDQVVLDSPPVNPVTDARILAASADATVLALRAGKSTRRTAQFAAETIASVGGRLLGVVVNDVPRGRESYGYYYGGYAYESASTNGAGARRGGDRRAPAGEAAKP